MRPIAAIALALVGVATAAGQDLSYRTPVRTPGVRLGRPVPLASSDIQQVGLSTPAESVRAQAPPDAPPPPPAFPGPPPAGAVAGGADAYNCGQVTNNADLGGFWTRCGERFRQGWQGVSGGVDSAVKGVQAPGAFQSDHRFDSFASPVSNPFYFEDPRALTELRPVFIWQRTPTANPVFAGGDNFFLDLQARLAFNQWFSIVIDELGVNWTEIQNPASGYQSHVGFSELHLGPKFTFYTCESSNTVMAGGVTFAIPAGPAKVFQNTGSLSVIPYFSVAQSFFRSDYGQFNFMNTDGYSFGDHDRTDFFFGSFHLDYDVGNAHVFYPLVELNWTHYTNNGALRPFNFEGSNLFNFGSTAAAGGNDLTLALGARYKVNQNLQFGLAPEFSLLGVNNGRHLDRFRLTFDMIFRY